MSEVDGIVRRIEWMAVGWGGLIAAIGLIVATNRGATASAIAVAVAFGFGGLMAGIRAEDLRWIHAAIAGIAAYVFHALFAVLAHLADVLGGPAAPGFLPGPNGRWGFLALLGIVVAIVGGAVAAAWLRPQGRDQRRRSA